MSVQARVVRPAIKSGSTESVRFRVEAMESWVGVPDSSLPVLTQMPPMLRRHAGSFGKPVCGAAFSVVSAGDEIPVVFASRYGDVSRSVDLLTNLAIGEELSPTSFGLSVHNAVPGLFAIARGARANSSAVAAGVESVELGVLEAVLQMLDGEERVLLVVSDRPLPEVYSQFSDGVDIHFAWAALLSSASGDGPAISLSWLPLDGSEREFDTRGSDRVSQVVKVFAGESRYLEVSGYGKRWVWQNHG